MDVKYFFISSNVEVTIAVPENLTLHFKSKL